MTLRYRCDACGFIYDPGQGHREKGISPGIDFDDLPEAWACPDCGSQKEAFYPADEEDEDKLAAT
jgi:rubredoxin